MEGLGPWEVPGPMTGLYGLPTSSPPCSLALLSSPHPATKPLEHCWSPPGLFLCVSTCLCLVGSALPPPLGRVRSRLSPWPPRGSAQWRRGVLSAFLTPGHASASDITCHGTPLCPPEALTAGILHLPLGFDGLSHQTVSPMRTETVSVLPY